MKTRKQKKGFTIVELVIVLAVVGVLAAILIPTFTNIINKANVAADSTLVRELNNALALDLAETGKTKHETMTDALDATKEYGFDVSRISTKASKNKILWDSKNGVFCYLKDNATQVEYVPASVKEGDELPAGDYRLWIISNEVDEHYSTYLYKYNGNKTIENLKTGLDVGNEEVDKITYNGTNGTTTYPVVIVTNGGTLTIDAGTSTVKHYGEADKVDVKAVAPNSYHENGTVKLIAVKEGHVKLEGKAEVNGIYVYNGTTYKTNGDVDTKDNSFKEIKITVDTGVEVPKLSRSAVNIASTGTKVCTVVTDQAKDVYLFNQGIYEQIKAIDHIDSADYQTESAYNTAVSTALAASAWVDTDSGASANTQTAAQQLANEFNGSYDGNGYIADQVVEVTTGDNAGTYTVKFNQTTREFETYQGETKVTATAVVEAVAEVADVSSETGKTPDEAETSSALKGTGTQTDPFQIYDYETMQKISDFYDLGYYYFEVALDKTDNGKINCKNWNSVDLKGYFDGHGVQFINLDNELFGEVYNSSISNFDIYECNITNEDDATSAVSELSYNSNYNNITITGGTIIAGEYAGSFISWTTGDFENGRSGSSDYTSFTNCNSTATLISMAGQVGGFVAHPYTTVSGGTRVDMRFTFDNSYYNGIMKTTETEYYHFHYIMGQCETAVKIYWNNMDQTKSNWQFNGPYEGKSASSAINYGVDENQKQYFDNSYALLYTGTHDYISVTSTQCSDEIGSLITAPVSTGATRATIKLLISPNDYYTEDGSYTRSYIETQDMVKVDGKWVAQSIYNCEITINGNGTSSTGYNANHTLYNIVNSNYGKTHNGASAIVTEYIGDNLIGIHEYIITESNSVAVRVNGSSVKSAAVGLEYVYDFGQDLSNYDVSVGFVTLNGWSWSFTNNFHEVVEENYFTIEGSRVIIHNIEKKSCGEYDGKDYQSYTCKIGIKITEKSN